MLFEYHVIVLQFPDIIKMMPSDELIEINLKINFQEGNT